MWGLTFNLHNASQTSDWTQQPTSTALLCLKSTLVIFKISIWGQIWKLLTFPKTKLYSTMWIFALNYCWVGGYHHSSNLSIWKAFRYLRLEMKLIEQSALNTCQYIDR